MPDEKQTANYVQVGLWTKCAHCGTVNKHMWTHYCGAPWQTPASDVPADWIGRCEFAQEG